MLYYDQINHVSKVKNNEATNDNLLPYFYHNAG